MNVRIGCNVSISYFVKCFSFCGSSTVKSLITVILSNFDLSFISKIFIQ